MSYELTIYRDAQGGIWGETTHATQESALEFLKEFCMARYGRDDIAIYADGKIRWLDVPADSKEPLATICVKRDTTSEKHLSKLLYWAAEQAEMHGTERFGIPDRAIPTDPTE